VKTSPSISRLEAGQRGVAGADEWQQSASGEEGDGADRRAPHGSDVRERRRLCQSAQSRREYAFRQIRQRGLGQVGRARVRRPVGEATGSDKFSGQIEQVLKCRKRTSNEIGQVLKTDQFCQTGPDREGGGGPRLG
jgi:hypothetical protein